MAKGTRMTYFKEQLRKQESRIQAILDSTVEDKQALKDKMETNYQDVKALMEANQSEMKAFMANMNLYEEHAL